MIPFRVWFPNSLKSRRLSMKRKRLNLYWKRKMPIRVNKCNRMSIRINRIIKEQSKTFKWKIDYSYGTFIFRIYKLFHEQVYHSFCSYFHRLWFFHWWTAIFGCYYLQWLCCCQGCQKCYFWRRSISPML